MSWSQQSTEAYLFCLFGRKMTNMHQSITLHFELVQWKQYVPSTLGTPPDYLKNWQVLYKKVMTVPADNYTTQLRVKACEFCVVMP